MKIVLILLALLILSIVSAFSDTTHTLVSFDFEPKVVDVSKADQKITFTAQIRDDLSGISKGQPCSFRSPSGSREHP